MSEAFPYSLLEIQIAAAFERVAAAHPEHKVKKYTTWGGGDEAPSWKAIGFHLRLAPEVRLVCEALHYENKPVAVVRVYREGTPDSLYARKWAEDITRFFDAVTVAADIFVSSLPSVPPPPEPVEVDISWLPISEAQREMIQRAPSPLPPPFSLAATKEA